MTTTPRRRGRPRRPALTRDGIAAAALALTESAGYEKLTMSRLASRLGVAPSALYNHVQDKSELLVLLQEEVMGQVRTAELDQALAGSMTYAAALRCWARSYRDVFAAHTPLIPVIATLPIEGAPRTQHMYDVVADVLAHAGVAQDRIVPRIIVVESFIFGSAYDATAPAEIFEVTGEEDALPHFLPAVAAFRARLSTTSPGSASGSADAPSALTNPFADDPFEAGLDLLLADVPAAR
ncbi:MAG: TetR/AcrR family transcriptional regulator [Micrococcus sp.]|nr:TetR/AcrR family transcriptional regulator [Micrococcus sp.]